MRWIWTILTLLPALAYAAAPPVPATSTAPTTRTSEMEQLLDGVIRYAPPAGWELVNKADNNLQANYKAADGTATLQINVSPQTRDVPPEFAKQMAVMIGKGIRESADRSSNTIVLAPRVEPDDRFFLKIHDRLAGAEGAVDRVQLYRVMGLNIVHVSIAVMTESAESAKAVHAIGESLLETMRLARGPKRVVFPRSQLKIISPVDWVETKTDQANGLVVIYRDPKEPSRQITVRSRVLPKDARENPARRDVLLDRMVDEERRQPPFITPPKDEQSIGGGKSLRHLRTQLVRVEEPLQVDTRYLVVGESLVSVRSAAREGDEELEKIAETLAGGIAVIR